MWRQIFIMLLALLIPCYCDKPQKDIKSPKYTEAVDIAIQVISDFYAMFENCVRSTKRFLIDDLHSFVIYPARTTVGFAPKFSVNRKFFANLIQTTKFKAMLEKDEEELKKNLVKKLWFCDEAIMDPELLKDFYDREVDQSKV